MKNLLLLIMCMWGWMSLPAAAEIVPVVENENSGIEGATLTATFKDGTVLGFREYGFDEVYFCGAVSQRTQLTVPDSVQFKSRNRPVSHIGYAETGYDRAASLKEMYLPVCAEIINYLPASLDILHVKHYLDDVRNDQFLHLNQLMVPQELLSKYRSEKLWYNRVLILAEGKQPQKFTIQVNTPGEFSQKLLDAAGDWMEVNELKVVGELQDNDLQCMKRMRQLTSLDLSEAKIRDIPESFCGTTYLTYAYEGFSSLHTLLLPDVQTIDYCAFANCYRLKNVEIKQARKINKGAFARCAFSQFHFPDSLNFVGDNAFSGTRLVSAALPSGVRTLPYYAFSDCSRLTSVDLPGVEEIKESSFSNTALVTVALPQVRNIGYYAFKNCHALKQVIFSDQLATIGSEAFAYCDSLTKIDLPGSVLSESSSFMGCQNVRQVICRAFLPPQSSDRGLLESCDLTQVKFYVPQSSIAAYRQTKGWQNFYRTYPLSEINEKVTHVHVYKDLTIDQGTEIAEGADFLLDWQDDNHNGYTRGTLDYNGSELLSLNHYYQKQYMGDGYENCREDERTTLIANGPMRADEVSTRITFYSESRWYFISFPYDVKVSDIIYPENCHFAIRRYVGKNRADLSGDTWADLSENDVMQAYQGYIFRCEKSRAAFVFPAVNNARKNQLFSKENVSYAIHEYPSEFEHNRSWNLVGNPYPCCYDIRSMAFTAPLTVWNRYESRYDAYSPQDDDYVLNPAEAFFIQCPVGATSLTFQKEGRQKTPEVKQSRQPASALHPGGRQLFNLLLSDGTRSDRTRVVLNEQALTGYELDKDASKFINDDQPSLLVYTLGDGVRYAINERPAAGGSVGLGVYLPAQGSYTLSLKAGAPAGVQIADRLTGKCQLLDQPYQFEGKAGYDDHRFQLLFASETTGLENAGVENASPVHFGNGRLSADAPYDVYGVDGRLISRHPARTSVVLPRGVYVVVCKDVEHKIVVK